MHDVIIVGGGVIGLSVARELAVQGSSVLVLDRGNPRDATSWAAAGMLAPQSEADGASPFFDLCLASAKLYPDWANHLHEESGIDPEYADSGLLFVASTEEELCRLKRSLEWQQSIGLKGELLSAEAAIRLEPHLTLPLTGAIFLPDECHVTPRRLLEALTGACAGKKVEIRNGVRVLDVMEAGGRVTGVRTSAEQVVGGKVIIASGVRSPQIGGLSPTIPVTPRKGQILSLTSDARQFTRMIRWQNAYMVPRRSGELIVGATNEDAGFDRSITPAGVGSLLEHAQQLSSHIADLPIGEIWTGLRPATPDGLPVIGAAGVEGLFYATGHYRNGILLAPITAASVASVMENRPAPVPLEAFAPSRFAV
jgi:glycine oxidase